MAQAPYPSEPRGLAAISLAGVRLTYRGWTCLGAAIVAVAAAYGSGKPQLLSIGALLAALPVIAVIYVVVRRPRVAITRSFSPHVVSAGSATTVTLDVRNRSAWPSPAARWADELAWPPFSTREADLPGLTARGGRSARTSSLTVTYSVNPPRRGVFDIGPLTVRLRDAFGLAWSVAPIGGTARIVVTPEVIPLASGNPSVAPGDGQSRIANRRSSGDDDDTTTREYRQGDAMRRVHWRATARKGDLMVRQEEQRSVPDARIILDTRRSGYRSRSSLGRPARHTDEPESEAFEWSVRMLASVHSRLRRSGFHVTVDETGAPQLAGPSPGGRRGNSDDHLREQLATIGLVDSNGPIRHSTAGAGPIIGILGELDADLVEWLVHSHHPGELAIAFLVRPASAWDELAPHLTRDNEIPEAAARLLDSGWLVVPVRANDDHCVAWDIAMESGWSRVSR